MPPNIWPFGSNRVVVDKRSRSPRPTDGTIQAVSRQWTASDDRKQPKERGVIIGTQETLVITSSRRKDKPDKASRQDPKTQSWSSRSDESAQTSRDSVRSPGRDNNDRRPIAASAIPEEQGSGSAPKQPPPSERSESSKHRSPATSVKADRQGSTPPAVHVPRSHGSRAGSHKSFASERPAPQESIPRAVHVPRPQGSDQGTQKPPSRTASAAPQRLAPLTTGTTQDYQKPSSTSAKSSRQGSAPPSEHGESSRRRGQAQSISSKSSGSHKPEPTDGRNTMQNFVLRPTRTAPSEHGSAAGNLAQARAPSAPEVPREAPVTSNQRIPTRATTERPRVFIITTGEASTPPVVGVQNPQNPHAEQRDRLPSPETPKSPGRESRRYSFTGDGLKKL